MVGDLWRSLDFINPRGVAVQHPINPREVGLADAGNGDPARPAQEGLGFRV